MAALPAAPALMQVHAVQHGTRLSSINTNPRKEVYHHSVVRKTREDLSTTSLLQLGSS
jgi:hypothetical protein